MGAGVEEREGESGRDGGGGYRRWVRAVVYSAGITVYDVCQRGKEKG